MIAEEFLLSLPSDPDEAFPVFEEYCRSKFLDKASNQEGDYYERQYITQILAFVNFFNIDIGVSSEVPYATNDFWGYFNKARQRIEFFVTRSRLKTVYTKKSGQAAIYVLSPSLKVEIRHYIEKIKTLIEELSLPEIKKNSLMAKLNAF